MLKITPTRESEKSFRICLCGELTKEYLPEVERLLAKEGIAPQATSLDLANVTFVDPTLGREYTECLTWRRHAIERIVSLRPRAVLMGSANVYVSDGARPSPWRVSLDEWLTGTRDTLAAFQRAGIQTVLLRDMPRPRGRPNRTRAGRSESSRHPRAGCRRRTARCP